ncbi:MAG: PKD domain-containing protein, partial [Bacteroidetes bacterium]|nr:PKD domain-containing protein [Bacteroidota bacterium]
MRLKLLLSAFLVSVLLLPTSTTAQSSYCTPKYSGNGYQNTGNPTSFFTHVLRVAIGNMDKSIAPPASAFTSQVYYDFTSSDSIRLTRTGTYPLTIELGNGANRQTVAVWIDYNQNNVFESTEIVFRRTDIENQGDHKYLASLTVPKNAVLGHTRMRIGTIYGNATPNPCTNSRTDNFPAFIADWSQNFQDYTIEIVKPTVQKFESITLSHTNFDEVVPGSSTNEILRIEVTTNEDGLISPLTVDSLYFNLLGNTNLKDVTKAKLYYTGKNPTFNTSTPLDSVSNPALNFTLTNNRTLRQGTNYFWLTLSISQDALIGNAIDARCNGVHVLTKRIPTIVSPGGVRRVGYCVSKGNRSMFVYPRWVRFNTISQFSGFSTTGYSNYTFRSTEVQRGDTVTLSIDVGNSVNNSFTRAWIDFNADGDLSDPGEMVLFDSITTANTTPTYGPVVAQVYIPTNAKIGSTRMRITSASKSDQAPWKSPPEPCDAQVEIGEVEDYTVVIAEQGEPVADFKFNTVCQGDTTRFFDGSYTFSIYSISSWDWDFGDGKTSTDQNPTHVYAQAGTYKVRLVANTNKPGTADTVYKIVTVEKPNIDFEMSTNLSKEFITFTDATSGATVVSWNWNFGDPNSLSNTAFGQTVFHEYDTAKTYTVTLVVRTLGGCVDSIKRNITIVDELKPVAVISANDFNPYQTAPLQLQDLSVNRPSSWRWSITPSSHNFVNGTSSSSQNPIVTLNALTTYTVKLVASNSAGSDSTTRDFTTKAYKAPTADFSANQTTVKAGQIVSFLDKSTNDPTKWKWNFGDGDSSLNSNPIHEYAKTGTYTVRLDVENPAGKDFEVKTGYIDVSDQYVMCESDVTSSPLLKGTIYDAGGPNGNYGNNTDCGFLIKPPCAGSITLAFTSFGFISNDYLLVYDGEDASGKPLHPQGGFTGYSRPSPLKATSGAIYIEQHSDGFSDTTGFSATWSSTNNIRPVATMSGATNGYAGGQAIFNNTTKIGSSGSSNKWYVNGQLVSSNSNQYIHKFDSAGYDTLVLEVSNCAGVDTVRRVLKVNNSTQKPKANFTKSDTNRVFVNQTVKLLDLSDFGPSAWRWNIPSDFLDYIYVNGTSETDQNVELLFIEPGFYTVKLTVSNAFGADSLTIVHYLLVEPDIAMCSFPNESSAPGGRIADDGGIGYPYIQRNCDFLINPCADKVILSFVKDSFDYAPGDFLRIYDGTDATGVALHSGNGFTFNNLPAGKYIAESGAMYIEHSSQGNASRRRGFLANWTSVAYKNPIVDFSIPDTAYTGGNFVFIKNTTNEQGNDDVAYRWDFDNDGVYDDSTTKEPIYSFSKSGLVQVKLLVEACDFKDSVIKTIRILNPKAKPNAKFVVNNTNPSTTDKVVFQDRSTNGPNKYRWEITPPNFNITNGSDTFPFMEGFFNSADSYDVKLVVKNKFGADSILLQKHIVVVEYCDPIVSNAPVNELSITYVNMVDISNRSQPGLANYEDYTSTHQTNLTAGGTHPIIIQRGGAT